MPENIGILITHPGPQSSISRVLYTWRRAKELADVDGLWKHDVVEPLQSGAAADSQAGELAAVGRFLPALLARGALDPRLHRGGRGAWPRPAALHQISDRRRHTGRLDAGRAAGRRRHDRLRARGRRGRRLS